ncbi:uncharacterized protein LOC110443599 [Mizuhopecten yessoensis]|uniref:Uncharacterized protein n=1 Tax=Mizuhopecten yessoensis TaxID=6573 RepID=A0A210PEH6_MIZYE|nr:uncharacterized protein LOC110443599 [Mizuhopecten yessoensis]OWF34889.1 hypothetical protein KP79_PYT08705 [Mizuhopecten yessoensis]
MDLETQARERRLSDVARGKQYLRQIDSLAEKHWNKLEPRNISTRQVSVGPLKEYTFILNGSYQQGDDSVSNRVKSKRRIHSEQIPKINGKLLTDRVQSERLGGHYGVNSLRGTHLFNQWGSNIDPLAEKVTLKKGDIQQTFSFGDANRKVQKPSPKKGVLMSRVSSDFKDRQIKTNTDFRSSRNGMVAVIHPVGPSPDAEIAPDVIDQQMIEREQTSVMLSRIDRMLHPNRYALKTKLAPSEQEVSHNSFQASSDTCKSLKKNIQQAHSNGGQKLVPRTKEDRPKLLSNPAYAPKTSGNPVKTFAQMLNELDSTQINVDRKCRLWINKLTFDSYE